jgi:hypothetical protein
VIPVCGVLQEARFVDNGHSWLLSADADCTDVIFQLSSHELQGYD